MTDFIDLTIAMVTLTPTKAVLVLVTLERLAIIVCIALIFTRLPFFQSFQENWKKGLNIKTHVPFSKLFKGNWKNIPDRKTTLQLIVFFSIFGILGTVFGIVVDVIPPSQLSEVTISHQSFTDRIYLQLKAPTFWENPYSFWDEIKFSPTEAIINFRLMILTISGLLGGPVVGLFSGLIVGAARSSLGGVLYESYTWVGISIGLSAGILSYFLTPKQRYSPFVVMGLCFLMEGVRRSYLMSQLSVADGSAIMENITYAMLVANTIGAYVFMKVIDMVNKKRKLIIEEEKRKEAEVRSLLLYMVPHFIISSLGVIKAKVSSAPALAEKQLHALSTFTRNSLEGVNQLDDGKDHSINDEINHVKDYLIIMHGHYPKLSFSSTFDENLLDFKCSLFVLQPLVENAINYGCKYKKEGDKISISITDAGNKIHLSVKDNGGGIPIAIKQQLGKTSVTSSRFGTGMAFLNVVQRLQKIFNDKASYTIDSEPNKGTEITLIIPKQEIDHDE